MELYRYEAHSQRSWISDDDTELTGVKLELVICQVRRSTPKGVWIHDDRQHRERWVSLTSRRAYAYQTKELALDSFGHRNAWYIGALERRLREAKLAREAITAPGHEVDAPTFFEQCADGQ